MIDKIITTINGLFVELGERTYSGLDRMELNERYGWCRKGRAKTPHLNALSFRTSHASFILFRYIRPTMPWYCFAAIIWSNKITVEITACSGHRLAQKIIEKQHLLYRGMEARLLSLLIVKRFYPKVRFMVKRGAWIRGN
jgi:hypothetical protein